MLASVTQESFSTCIKTLSVLLLLSYVLWQESSLQGLTCSPTAPFLRPAHLGDCYVSPFSQAMHLLFLKDYSF